MRDINRIDDYLDVIKKIWKQNPDLRFSQLVLNVFTDSSLDYYIEDDKSLEMFKHMYGIGDD
jgi:uncharacterized protein YihD (DUF1040 family)